MSDVMSDGAARVSDTTSDAQIRAMMSDQPVPAFEETAFTVPPPLEEATVAIVTTAGLHHSDEEGWPAEAMPARDNGSADLAEADDAWLERIFWRADASFRVLDAARRDLTLGNWSPNFDRTGVVSDLNVVFPIDRLEEMARERVIGRVSKRHLAFTGAQSATVSTIRQDTGPAAAKLLRASGVDVVLLTGV
jgi:hypothetical protein